MGQRWKNLSFRLPAFILLASLLPLTAFGLFAINHSKKTLLATQARATLRTAVMAAELIEQDLHNVQRHLAFDAENLDLLALAPEDLEWALLSMLHQNPAIVELTMIDGSGREVAKVAENEVFLPEMLTDQSSSEAFLAAMAGKDFIGEPMQHDDGHKNTGYISHVAVPLFGQVSHSVTSVLVADLALSKILNTVTDIRIGPRGLVYVLNGSGTIIAHQDFSLVLKETALALTELNQVSEEGSDTLAKDFINAAGVSVQGAFARVKDTDWVVVGERPLDAILEKLQETSRLLQMLLAGLFLLLLPVTYFFFRRTVVPLQLLERGAVAIGNGQFGAPIPVRSTDEIGRVSSAFNSMASSLQKMTEDRERARWLENGLRGLDDELRGNLRILDVARRASSYLARYVGAPVAAFYVNDGANNYSLTAGFAHDGAKSDKQAFALGQGLVGQVAYERRVTVLQEVPEHYLDVTSGLGASGSQALMLLPLIHNDEVLGILELGAFEPFSEQDRAFLEQASGPLAIALGAARAGEQLGQSLEKSQRFSEELQAQQEELQAANEELEEQTQRLRASEEELQAQQEELQASNEELEEKTLFLQQQQDELAQKNLALEMTQERLKQHSQDLQVASRYKSEFLANMSHELRTPLNSLLILSQDLASNREGNLSPGQIESAEVVHSSGNDLLRLINEILDLSKIEAGKMELHIDRIDVAEMQQSLEKTFQHMAQVKGLAFAVELAEGAPKVLQSDPQRLNQILKNLISNALKFTTQGEVTLTIGPAPAEVLLLRPGLDASRCCAIAVSDTGIGIPADKLEDIFGAFQQVDGSISRQYGGTGLGLTISRELAGLLGGELQVASQHGAGSTFTLYLPMEPQEAGSSPVTPAAPVTGKAAPAAVQVVPERPAAPSIADDRETLTAEDRVILIVEDDLAFAKILADLCHDKGFSYLHAGDGETGMQLAEQYQPMAILLDIRLPGMHGLELLEALKSRIELRHIPVHMISVEDRSHEALRLGAAGFLSKPATREDLTQALARLADVASGRLARLLVVEDNRQQRESIVKLIGNGDVESLEAASGHEALDILQKEQIDCVILDLGLPDMAGLELLKQLQTLDAPVPPVIIYTGRDLSRGEEEALNEYTASIIIKGIRSPERLLDEASLFLHRVVAKLPEHKQRMINELRDVDGWSQTHKILLVDDDMRNIFALSKVLEQQGLQVVKAANGLKALEALDKEPDIDLVLMDIMMPVMDGYEAMRKIRQQQRFARLPMLALTAKAMQEDRGKCIEAGANDYLPKPVDISKLLSLLRVWLH